MTDAPNEESPAPAAPPPAAPEIARGRGGARRWRRIVPWLVVIVVVALIAASAPMWVPLLPGYGGDQALVQRLAAAEAAQQRADARVAALEAQMQQLQAGARATASAAALAALADRVAALEQRQAAATDSAASIASIHDAQAAVTARLDDDEARLGKLAARSPDEGADRMLLVALTELRVALADSRPFAGELAAATALGHGDSDVAAALAPLASDAATGIPSTAMLAAQFSTQTAPQIFRAAASPAAPASGDGWGERILAHVRELVVVHRTDGGDATDTAVAQAERALASGDLPGAVAAVTALTGAPAAAAASWLAVAKQRLAAEGALDTLTQQLVTRVAGSGH